jgi:hypothetical protein
MQLYEGFYLQINSNLLQEKLIVVAYVVFCGISGSHGDQYEDISFLRYTTV